MRCLIPKKTLAHLSLATLRGFNLLRTRQGSPIANALTFVLYTMTYFASALIAILCAACARQSLGDGTILD